MEGNMKKHTVKVGSKDSTSTVGETVSFTAERLGTALVDGGADDGGYNVTYYRLQDRTFRVLVEGQGIALLLPSNMVEAMQNGQRNNYSYGRMTLEEMKAESTYKLGEIYEKLMENHPETVQNRVRDLD